MLQSVTKRTVHPFWRCTPNATHSILGSRTLARGTVAEQRRILLTGEWNDGLTQGRFLTGRRRPSCGRALGSLGYR